MFFIRFKLNFIVISLSLYLLIGVNCDIPDICSGSSVTAAEKVLFLDGIERYFISSGNYYWFVNETSDLPNSVSAKQLPFGCIPDAALIKDTRQCDGQYTLLLIQKRDITGSNEEEWITLEYNIGFWGENGTDSGLWNDPTRIARCSKDSKVCSTSDNYFATMNFDFKRSLDAAFGVIGQSAYFIQDSLIYNVNYSTPCVNNPYRQVIAQSPQPLPTRVSAGLISDNQIMLFDREFYIDLTNSTNITADVLVDENWVQSPENFFVVCPPLTTSLRTLIRDIFADSRSASISATMLTVIIVLFILIIITIFGLIFWMSLRRKTMLITSNTENADNNSDSPLHEEHLLKSDSPKVTNNANTSPNESPNQVRVPLQTSC